jgi:hypothetical protein
MSGHSLGSPQKGTGASGQPPGRLTAQDREYGEAEREEPQ